MSLKKTSTSQKNPPIVSLPKTKNNNNGTGANFSNNNKDSSSTSTQQSTDSMNNTIIPESPTHDSATSARRGRDPFDAPCRKLSSHLIKTYKNINSVYYEKRRARKAAKAKAKQYNDGHDDQHYDYKLIEKEILDDRYEVRERIGKGSFGQVVRAFDRVLNTFVAIKIVKSKRAFFQQARTEIDLLNYLNEQDRGDQFNIVQLQKTFVHHRHQCLVFELLACNLYELLRNTRFLGVSFNLIRKFGQQILKCLSFLAAPEINVIHCDLKPENILLRDPQRSAIKVIDFGSSCHGNKRMYTYIQSRFYRSPEVMLGLEYGVQIDMWSLGCILVEMHTGEPLFNGTDEFDQMHRVCSLLGLPPSHMIEGAKTEKRKIFFVEIENGAKGGSKRSNSSNSSSSSSSSSQSSQSSGGSVEKRSTKGTSTGVEDAADADDSSADDAIMMDSSSTEDVTKSGTKETSTSTASSSVGSSTWGLRIRRKSSSSSSTTSNKTTAKGDVETGYPNRTLDDVLGVEIGGPGGRRKGEEGHSPENYRLFRDLVNRMLAYDPRKRIRPLEALNHPFFWIDNVPEDGKRRTRSRKKKGGTGGSTATNGTSGESGTPELTSTAEAGNNAESPSKTAAAALKRTVGTQTPSKD
jgi:dual specificity tyrosine-phosphorylation-regulated kinase 1